jgi:nucleotide-binding universal stress UspA family protein
MSDRKILLGLDGSAQSRYAAELSWSMAKTAGIDVDAVHVVDSLAAWDFLAFDIAGFIGSGPYFAAHETMRNSLNSIGQNLIDAYKSLAEAQGIKGETFLDDGTTIREICWRAKDYSMVVLGHRSTGMQSPDEDKRKIPRRSVAETLTHYSPKPLLIVQDRCKLWTKLRILLGGNQVHSDLLNSCLDFVSALNMTPSVRYLFTVDKKATGEVDKTAPDGLRVVTDLTKLVPGLAKAKVDVKTCVDINEFMKQDAEEDPDTLLVVPVTNTAGVRKTSLGIAPDLMVRYLNHAAILFWMEADEAVDPAREESVSTSAAT